MSDKKSTIKIDTIQYKRFPMSYLRRLPCPHWMKFPVKVNVEGKSTIEDICTQCVYDPPAVDSVFVEATDPRIHDFINRHPKTMIKEP